MPPLGGARVATRTAYLAACPVVTLLPPSKVEARMANAAATWGGPDTDDGDERITNPDAKGNTNDHLHRATPSPTRGRAQHDHCRDRREERSDVI